MASKGQTSDTLEEIQSAADRMAEWIQQNLTLVGGVVVGVLVLAGGASLLTGTREAAESEASTTLADARTEYLEAMGAPPGAFEVPELANPAAAERIQNEYRTRFQEIADAHQGTVSGALARLEVAQLWIDEGNTAEALATYEQALAEGAGGDRFRGMLLQRIAQALEEMERWEDAAVRHQEAAELDDYPLRHWALADAARCLVSAGNREGAHALYQRLEQDAPDLRLPDHQRMQMRELAAASAS